MTTLIGDLVELAREDPASPPVEPVELAAVVTQAVTRVRRRTTTVEFVVHTEPWWVTGDAAALERAITNLLDNAAKWSPPGGQRRRSSLQPGHGDRRDQGQGISDADLPHVFDRFYRSTESRGHARLRARAVHRQGGRRPPRRRRARRAPDPTAAPRSGSSVPGHDGAARGLGTVVASSKAALRITRKTRAHGRAEPIPPHARGRRPPRTPVRTLAQYPEQSTEQTAEQNVGQYDEHTRPIPPYQQNPATRRATPGVPPELRAGLPAAGADQPRRRGLTAASSSAPSSSAAPRASVAPRRSTPSPTTRRARRTAPSGKFQATKTSVVKDGTVEKVASTVLPSVVKVNVTGQSEAGLRLGHRAQQGRRDPHQQPRRRRAPATTARSP